jgi:hypothetical protein
MSEEMPMDVDAAPNGTQAKSGGPASNHVPAQPTSEQFALFNAPTTQPYRSPVETHAIPDVQPAPADEVDSGGAQMVLQNQPFAQSQDVATPVPRMYRTGYIYDTIMMLHCQDGYTPTHDNFSSGDGHPEEPMRIKRIFAKLAAAGLIGRMKKLESRNVTMEEVMLVHTEDHWDKVQSTECE